MHMGFISLENFIVSRNSTSAMLFATMIFGLKVGCFISEDLNRMMMLYFFDAIQCFSQIYIYD